MVPSFFEIENVLKTLPIGYYIGRNVPVTLTHEESSYYTPMNDKINISYPMLHKVMAKIENKLNLENIETLVRTLLYHEISHAFITPKDLRMNQIINIFEDSRIETLCKDYYLDVDFKQLLMLVNNWNGLTSKDGATSTATTSMSAWYELIRYHIGKPIFLVRAAKIIRKYANLHRFSSWYANYKYSNEVNALYNDVKLDFELMKNKSSISNNTNENELENNTPDENLTNKQREIKELQELLDTKSENEINDMLDDLSIMQNNDIKQIFANAQIYVNTSMHERLFNIISTNRRITKNNASAINAYSGVFNPRSVVRDDYKWFVQQNRQGNVKHYSKIKLNLFIDNSGSFGDNENIINTLLFTLQKLEKQDPNFSFDLVTMNMEFVLRQKNDRIIECYGTNNIPPSAKYVVKQVQDKHSTNYNVVLFDGFAFSGARYPNEKAFGIFNIANTVMILEDSNRDYANAHCKNTKRIYTTSYAEELIDQVCIALSFLLR